VSDAGEDSACEVEEEVAGMAEFVFDDIAEYPEEEHVAGDVHESAVEEGAGDELPEVWCCLIEDVVIYEVCGLRPEVELECDPSLCIVWEEQGDEKDEDVDRDERVVDPGS